VQAHAPATPSPSPHLASAPVLLTPPLAGEAGHDRDIASIPTMMFNGGAVSYNGAPRLRPHLGKPRRLPAPRPAPPRAPAGHMAGSPCPVTACSLPPCSPFLPAFAMCQYNQAESLQLSCKGGKLRNSFMVRRPAHAQPAAGAHGADLPVAACLTHLASGCQGELAAQKPACPPSRRSTATRCPRTPASPCRRCPC
jgi:hypothetical protein